MYVQYPNTNAIPLLFLRTTSLDRSRQGRPGLLYPPVGPGGISGRSESMSAVPGSAPVGENTAQVIREEGGRGERRLAVSTDPGVALLSDFEYYKVDFLGRRKVKRIPKMEGDTDFDELFEKEGNRDTNMSERLLEEERAKEAREKAKALAELNMPLPGRSISQPVIRKEEPKSVNDVLYLILKVGYHVS